MEYLIKIALTGIVISILILLLKGFKSDLAPALAVAGSVVLLGAVLIMVSGAADAVKDLFQSSELESEHMKSILKIIGAAYVVDFSASLCRDMGEVSMASKIELAGRVFIVMLAVPWAQMLIGAVKSLGG
ncbi:MAG: SpoIIIAC/SpoIIIAD family protein [Clostridia bacterium]